MNGKPHNVFASKHFSHERFGRGLAGLFVLVSAGLGLVHTPYWLFVTLGIAINLMISSLTDRCPVKSLLVRLGVPGERDLGRAEALGETDALAHPRMQRFSGSACPDVAVWQ